MHFLASLSATEISYRNSGTRCNIQGPIVGAFEVLESCNFCDGAQRPKPLSVWSTEKMLIPAKWCLGIQQWSLTTLIFPSWSPGILHPFGTLNIHHLGLTRNIPQMEKSLNFTSPEVDISENPTRISLLEVSWFFLVLQLQLSSRQCSGLFAINEN